MTIAKPAGPKLEVRGVSKAYGRDGAVLSVLDDISLVVSEQEFLVLLGPSGCGKSTLLRILDGIDTPNVGSVVLDGKDVTGSSRFAM